MNIKRFLAAASASIVAVSAMAVTSLTSFAAFSGASPISGSGVDWTQWNVGQYAFDLEKYDPSQAAQVEVTIEISPDTSDPLYAYHWANGKVITQSDKGNGSEEEWSIGEGETSVTVTIDLDTSVYEGTIEYAVINFSNYGAVAMFEDAASKEAWDTSKIHNEELEASITSLKILDSDGKELAEKPADDDDDDDNNNGGTTGDSTDNKTDDNNKTDESKPEESKPEESKPEESKPASADTTSKIKPAHEQDVPSVGSGPADQRPVPSIGYTDGANGNGGNAGNSGNSGTTTNPSDPGTTTPTNPNTGVAMAFAPALIAGAAVVVAKKRK